MTIFTIKPLLKRNMTFYNIQNLKFKTKEVHISNQEEPTNLHSN